MPRARTRSSSPARAALRPVGGGTKKARQTVDEKVVRHLLKVFYPEIFEQERENDETEFSKFNEYDFSIDIKVPQITSVLEEVVRANVYAEYITKLSIGEKNVKVMSNLSTVIGELKAIWAPDYMKLPNKQLQTWNLFGALISRFNNLSILNLDYLDDADSFAAILHFCPKLEVLSVSEFSKHDHGEDPPTFTIRGYNSLIDMMNISGVRLNQEQQQQAFRNVALLYYVYDKNVIRSEIPKYLATALATCKAVYEIHGMYYTPRLWDTKYGITEDDERDRPEQVHDIVRSVAGTIALGAGFLWGVGQLLMESYRIPRSFSTLRINGFSAQELFERVHVKTGLFSQMGPFYRLAYDEVQAL